MEPACTGGHLFTVIIHLYQAGRTKNTGQGHDTEPGIGSGDWQTAYTRQNQKYRNQGMRQKSKPE